MERSDYEMFSAAGNQACHSLVVKLRKMIASGNHSKSEILLAAKEGLNKIAKVHKEVDDSEPIRHVCHKVNDTLVTCEYDEITDDEAWKYFLCRR